MPRKNYVIQRAVSPWRHHLKQRHGATRRREKGPVRPNQRRASSKPQDLTIQFSFKMTDLTGFILAEIAGSSSSETSNIVQVVAVTAAWQKDMMETLLRYHQLQAKLLAAAISIGASAKRT
jgi:hypothetical protein